ncbi:hypothetical protein DACRYDRAFT_21791 [Dacryopinax primogenitus]|uniref:Uncharacterized protein n=1 Tax=Dacryopinax primogenitus (strain DJM 731) TaxID=1858805 RepID=M5FXT2_DACPD|nr:uncharacterized protein DACRYDRAFT_21791 [Dacryopinax primogenitus]EJU02846.1 hypothetical protein DACRYDRAFT_21791 [Dacryopinax primogenitus]
MGAVCSCFDGPKDEHDEIEIAAPRNTYGFQSAVQPPNAPYLPESSVLRPSGTVGGMPKEPTPKHSRVGLSSRGSQ